ncbi:iron permease [Gautieria morchelliformis]|nr:iron permease [Gautieria morchelliformis]
MSAAQQQQSSLNKLTDKEHHDTTVVAPNNNRGYEFWMVFVANLVVDLLSALDLTAVSTALPTIVARLNGTDFIWVGSSYAIGSTAVVPTVGGLVSIFGRKPILLAFIVFFAIGSAISGAAQSMSMLIAGRAIQGFGGGGCISCTEIIYADIVPLPERGKFLGVTASVWAFACGIGPLIGGALANSGSWRWLFLLNLPLCAVSTILVFIFFHVHTPKDSFRSKIGRMDWFGNAIIICSTTSVMIGLTWGGLRFPWTSLHVLVPLCLGSCGILLFFVVEAYWVREPTVPWFSMTNRTTLSGYLGTFFHGIASICVIYYLPVYFQASKTTSAIRSGVDFLGLALTIAPLAIITGASVQVFNRYRPQNYLGWILTMIGFGLLSTLNENSTTAQYIGFQVILGMGLGMIWIGTQFPILAPLPFSNNAHALAFFTFIRCLAQSWGTAIGGTILQNTLRKRLPASFTLSLPQGVQLAYAIIPSIAGMPQPIKDQVRAAFAQSTTLIWQVMIGISGLGLMTCLLMREVEMRKSLDEKWALKEKAKPEGAATP